MGAGSEGVGRSENAKTKSVLNENYTWSQNGNRRVAVDVHSFVCQCILRVHPREGKSIHFILGVSVLYYFSVFFFILSNIWCIFFVHSFHLLFERLVCRSIPNTFCHSWQYTGCCSVTSTSNADHFKKVLQIRINSKCYC